VTRPADLRTRVCITKYRGYEIEVAYDRDRELAEVALVAEALLRTACGLSSKADDAPITIVPVDDASVATREHIIALLGDDDTLLFPVGGHVVALVGAEHMLYEASALLLADIAAKSAAGHPDAKRIHHELAEASGVVVHLFREAGHIVSGAIEFPSDERWIAQLREFWRDTLDAVLDCVAQLVEQILVEGTDLGMILISLDERLHWFRAMELPRVKVPATAEERRLLIESLAREVLGTQGAGYVGAAEGMWTPGAEVVNTSTHFSSEHGVVLHAETRAGDCCSRRYGIIRQPGRPVKLELVGQSREFQPEGLFTGLLQVADSQPEGRTLDEDLLKAALAAHASTISTLGEGDSLMFAVGEQLVQVIGKRHTICECTLMQLANIKINAKMGNPIAQRLYSELVAGQGLLTHVETGGDDVTCRKVKFVADAEWLGEEDAAVNIFSIGSRPLR
jgi:hypothetical protein